MKKISIVLICMVSILLVAGCGKLNLNSYTTVNSTGEGDFSFQFIYDDTVASQCTNGFLKNKKNTPVQDQVKKYKKGNDKIDEYKVHFKNLDELNKKVSVQQDDFEVKVKENKGIIKTTYTYEMRFKKPINVESFKTYLQNEDSFTVMNQDKNSVENFLNEVTFTNAVKLPGKVISSNSTDSKDNYLVWNYYLNQIKPDTVMTATYEVEHKNNKVIIGTASALIIVILICAVCNRKKNIRNS